tara:strand:+ start:4007 stop:4477 length:471 start_codon:yes stop_codon:yes gene_type:complete
MFNLTFFEQWFNHIVGWPILVVVLLTLVYMKVNWKIATTMVPISLLALSFLMFDLERTLGRPYASEPIGKWMYVTHIVKKETIDLLIVDKDGTRLYTIKNTKKNKEKLEQSREKVKKGIPQEGEFLKEKNKLGKGTVDEPELVMHDLPVPEHLIKE